MSEFPLNIENKEDYPDKVSFVENLDDKYYESAEEKNKKTRALNELNTRLLEVESLNGNYTPYETESDLPVAGGDFLAYVYNSVNEYTDTSGNGVYAFYNNNWRKVENETEDYVDENNVLKPVNGKAVFDKFKEAVAISSIIKDSSKQMFNKTESELNIGFISNSNSYGSSSSYVYSNKIYIEEGFTYNGEGLDADSDKNGMRHITAFDSNNQHLLAYSIDGGSTNYPLTYTNPTGSNVAYVIVSILAVNLDTFQFEVGGVRTEYEDFGKITSINNTEIKDPNALRLDNLKNSFSDNLKQLNSTLVRGQYISGSDGLPKTSSSYCSIKVLDIKGTNINVLSLIKGSNSDDNSFGFRHIAFYDESDAFISGETSWGLNSIIPDNCSYVQVSVLLTQLPTLKISTDNILNSINNNDLNSESITIEAYGDSTTYGADLNDPENERWTTLLSNELNIVVGNNGSSGATAEEIGVLIGGYTPKVTVNGGIIKSDISRTQLTYLDVTPFGGSNIEDIAASLRLFDGTIIKGSLNKSTGFSAYYLESDINVGTQKIDLISDTGKMHRDNSIILLGAGVNNENQIFNGDYTADYVKQSYSNITDTLKKDFVVWGLLDRISEPAGTVKGDYIREMEDWFRLKYGSKFCDVRNYLASQQAIDDAQLIDLSYTPDQDDLDAVAANTTPPSFKASDTTVHLGVLGHKLQALFIKKHIQYYILN